MKLKEVKSLVANTYIDPENTKTPMRMSVYKMDFCFAVMCVVVAKKNNKKAIPPELKGKKIIIWNWKNLETFINKL